jgi:hypothetical protein
LADSCRITYDKTQPTITDLSVDKNYVKAGDVLTITAEVTDSSGISAVSADFSYSPEYTNRPTPTSVSMTNTGGDIYSVSYSIPSSWNEGIMYVKVAARDYTGENWVRSGETKSVTVDNTAPKSIITTPANDGDNSVVYSNSWNGSVAGTATDSLSGLGKVQLTIQNDENKYWDGTSWQSALVYVEAGGTTDNWTYSMSTSPSQGTYTISSHAVDNAGNMESSYKVTIVLDKTIPQVDLTMDPTDPDGSGSWYITRPTLTLTANDNFEVDFIEYRWSKNGTWTTYANPLKSPSEGTNTLYYRAVDLAGNVSDEGIKTLQWDQTDLTDGPLNVSASPNPTSGSTADVSWDKADDNIGIDKYTITWELRDGDDKHSKEVNGDVTETTISDLLEGTYKITVRAYDNSGHNQSATTDLTVDRTAPAAPALTLDATRDGEVDLSWTEIEDADDYIILYGLESGNHIYAARVGNITSYTVQGLTAGSYYFVVRAVDKADNQSSNSNEVSSGTILGAVGLGAGVGGPAAGFEEAGEVLGEETEAAEQELAEQAPTSDEETGDVLGTATSVGFFQSKLPWIMLGLQALALLIFEAIQRRQQSMLKFAISLGITLVLTGLYYLLRNPEYFAEGSITMMLNNWYWLSAIGIMILIRMIGYGFIEEVEL